MTPHEKWLQRKRQFIGSSDVGAILNINPYSSPLAVWAAKVYDIRDDENRAMRYGSYMERFISDEYEIATGRPMDDPGDFEILEHPDIPYIGVTLDRVTAGSESHPAPDGNGPAEIKTARSGDDWRAEPPLWYQTQLQTQIACMGATWGALIGWIAGSELVHFDILRDDDLMNVIYPQLDKFWWHVITKTPPADIGPRDLPVAKDTWSDGDGTTVDFDADTIAAVRRWEEGGDERRQAETKKDTAELIIRLSMEFATFGNMGDGTYIKKSIVKKKNGKQYTTLRRWRP